MIVAFALLRAFEVIHSPLSYNDTPSYLALDFLGQHQRPWTVPLVWTLLPTADLRELGQLLAGVCSWSVLALTLRAVVVDRWVGWLAMLGVLLLGLSGAAAGWDAMLLSESLASSLLVLTIALLIRVSERATMGRIAAVLGVVTLWIFTRQVNLILFLALLLPVMAYVLWHMRDRRGMAIAAVLVFLGLWSGFVLTRPGGDGIWQSNALHILENRIAPDGSALQFFRSHGLPFSPVIEAEKGNFPGGSSKLYEDPPLLSWVDKDFKSTYARFLLGEVPETAAAALGAMPNSVANTAGADTLTRPVLPTAIRETVWGTDAGGIALWLAIAGALGVLTMIRRRHVCGLPLIALMTTTVIFGTILIWTLTGDNTGPGLSRQFLPVAITLRAGILISIAFCADALRVSPHPAHD